MEGSAARTMEPPLPPGLIRLRDGRIVPRRSGWLEAGERLVCPFKHEMPPALNLHEGAMTVQCTDRTIKSEPRCGCLLYVATGIMGRFWIDITTDEDVAIKTMGIKPIAVARFLGIHFPK